MVNEPVLFCGPNFDDETKTWSTYQSLPPSGRNFDIGRPDLRRIVNSEDDQKIGEVGRHAF